MIESLLDVYQILPLDQPLDNLINSFVPRKLTVIQKSSLEFCLDGQVKHTHLNWMNMPKRPAPIGQFIPFTLVH